MTIQKSAILRLARNIADVIFRPKTTRPDSGRERPPANLHNVNATRKPADSCIRAIINKLAVGGVDFYCFIIASSYYNITTINKNFNLLTYNICHIAEIQFFEIVIISKNAPIFGCLICL